MGSERDRLTINIEGQNLVHRLGKLRGAGSAEFLPSEHPLAAPTEVVALHFQIHALILVTLTVMEIEPATPTLTEFTERIAGVLNRTAIDIGTILIEAKHAHPGRFMQWVEDELPFGMKKADQLMAISRAFRELPPEKREYLPAPWTTLFALTRLEPERFDNALESGLIRPDMTAAQARQLTGREPAPEPEPRPWKSGPPKGRVTTKQRLPLSLALGSLLRYDPSELTPTQSAALRRWLEGDLDELDDESELRRDGDIPLLPVH